MSNTSIKVGLIIADKDEYVHIENSLSNIAKPYDLYGLKGHITEIEGKHRNITLISICCGIGKVNASVATALIA